LSLNFKDFSSSQQENFSWVILEISEVPDSWDDQSWGSVQTETAPIPSQIERIQHIIKNADGDQRFI